MNVPSLASVVNARRQKWYQFLKPFTRSIATCSSFASLGCSTNANFVPRHAICWHKKRGQRSPTNASTATVGSNMATLLERTMRFVAALTDWVDQHRLDRLAVQQPNCTPHVARCLRPRLSGNKVVCSSKAHTDGVLVLFVGSLLAVIEHGVLWFHSSTISLTSRARTDVLARSLLHCWALSLLVSCARYNDSVTSSDEEEHNTWNPLLDTLRALTAVLLRRHLGSQTGAYSQSCSEHHVVVRNGTKPPVSSSASFSASVDCEHWPTCHQAVHMRPEKISTTQGPEP